MIPQHDPFKGKVITAGRERGAYQVRGVPFRFGEWVEVTVHDVIGVENIYTCTAVEMIESHRVAGKRVCIGKV